MLRTIAPYEKNLSALLRGTALRGGLAHTDHALDTTNGNPTQEVVSVALVIEVPAVDGI